MKPKLSQLDSEILTSSFVHPALFYGKIVTEYGDDAPSLHETPPVELSTLYVFLARYTV